MKLTEPAQRDRKSRKTIRDYRKPGAQASSIVINISSCLTPQRPFAVLQGHQKCIWPSMCTSRKCIVLWQTVTTINIC